MKRNKILWLILLVFLPLSLSAGSWQEIENPIFTHYNHGAVLLNDGRVLAVGGCNNESSCEIYNPNTNQWSLTDSLNRVHDSFGLIKLLNGKVLVIGGLDQGHCKSCEIFDPETETWGYTDSLNIGRSWRGSPHYNQGGTVLLPNGKVLVIGGSTTQSCEIFDPETETWTLVAPIHQHRWSSLGGLLSNGLVLSFHTYWTSSQGDPSTELYDPLTNTWTYGQPPLLPQKRDESGIIIPEGYLLVGGSAMEGTGGFLKNCEIYDAQTGEWSPTDSLEFARICYSIILLPNNKVLVAGGWDEDICPNSECQLYDLNTHTWQIEESMNCGRANFTTTLLNDGRVLAVGGISFPTAEIYSWNTAPWIDAIDGPNQGFVNDSISFSVIAIDEEQDSVSLRADWGDGVSDWSDYQPSNSLFTFSHSWQDSGNYEIRFQAKDQWAPQFHNSLGEWSQPFEIVISGVGINKQPFTQSEISIFPNPFQSSVTISLEQGEEKVKVQIFNVRGQLVRTLETKGTNTIFWDGKNSQGQEVPNGIYFCRLSPIITRSKATKQSPSTFKIVKIK